MMYTNKLITGFAFI